MLDPRDQSPQGLIARAAELGLTERQVRRWLGAILGSGECQPEAWFTSGLLPLRLRPEVEPLTRLALIEVKTSPKDGFQKFLFRTEDQLLVESVAIPLHKPGAVTICLSSQVGCAMGCVFCATARMTSRRNLQTWEIVDQFLQIRAHLLTQGRRVTGAVFMGMGEPFLNYDRVMAAADLLSFPVKNAIGKGAITVSTVGIVPQIERFVREQRPYRLSISIGAATDEKRSRLVPVASQFSLAQVMAAARRYAQQRRERVMIAYVCISGVNVFESDAQALGEIIGDMPVRLDLIEVQDSTGVYQAPTEGELATFRDALRRYLGQPVVRRYSGGADIAAACGTLAGTAPR